MCIGIPTLSALGFDWLHTGLSASKGPDSAEGSVSTEGPDSAEVPKINQSGTGV